MKQHKKGLAVWLLIVVLLFIASLLVGPSEHSETVQEAMRDAVQIGRASCRERV